MSSSTRGTEEKVRSVLCLGDVASAGAGGSAEKTGAGVREALEENDIISTSDLELMSDADFEALGFKMGIRNRIRRELRPPQSQ